MNLTHDLDLIPLSVQLRTSTATAHAEAENSDFIKKLFSGACSKPDYYTYLWSLYEIYTALETELEKHKNHSVTSLVYIPELFRKTPLVDDLMAWSTYRTTISSKVQNAIDHYTNYLKDIGQKNTELLIAHAYVRYMGDISGGQILSKILKRSFTNQSGFNFYDYKINDLKDMKILYRNRLDLVPKNLTESICREAQMAFKMNALVFQAL